MPDEKGAEGVKATQEQKGRQPKFWALP